MPAVCVVTACRFALALMTALGTNDREWQVVYDRLMSSAKLEAAFKRQDRRHREAKSRR